MPTESVPKRPIEAYHALIDCLVESRRSVSARLVEEEGVFSRVPDDVRENVLVAAMLPEQRSVLAKMLEAERTSAIHDALAELTWWILCRGVGLTFEGSAMPVDLSGMGLHGDFMGRLQGWNWPDDDESAG